VLAERVVGASSIEAGFAEYEQVWRPVVEEKQKVGRSAARWFLPSSRMELLARRGLLQVLRLPGSRTLLPAALAGKSSTLIRDLQPAH
jgi:2-polyprenyl-6-methoxyphenol hydroxylase-like FAD-dependent oxidoreductase